MSKVGFPIRKCPDQSLFAAPRTLSQRTTSFIASQRQGIHRIPLRHLIVLMNNARFPFPARRGRHRTIRPVSRNVNRSIVRKTSFCLPNTSGRPAVKLDGSSAHGPRDRGDPCPNVFPLYNVKHLAHPAISRSSNRKPFMDEPAGPAPGVPASGGARRDRTDDLMLAKHALSQLSYGPLFLAGRCAAGSRHQARRPVGLAARKRDRAPRTFAR